MYSTTRLAIKYLRYYFTAYNGRGHGIHSPFVYNFVEKVLNGATNFDACENIESLRKGLLKDHRMLEVVDMGAGSVISKSRRRKIADIARHVLKPKKFGRLLFNITHYYQPGNIIELGTSLGITTAYLALANPKATIISLEGAPAVAAIARNNFEQLAIKNIALIEGNFDDTLANALNGFDEVDLVFVDGNHRNEPTLRYFQLLLGKINNQSIIIFDDIHWSKEMEEAWELIKSHKAVTLSIDLFFIGLVFFRAEFKTKQHFVVNF